MSELLSAAPRKSLTSLGDGGRGVLRPTSYVLRLGSEDVARRTEDVGHGRKPILDICAAVLSRPNAFALALLLCLSCSGAPHLALSAPPRPQDPKGKEMLARVRGAYGKLFEELERVLCAPGASPFDIAHRAALLGKDPGRLFAFVRDEIATEPYSGLLRGERGVLVSRAGNSLEKALLLRALLSASGKEARMVQGFLPPERATELVRHRLSRAAPKDVQDFAGAPSREIRFDAIEGFADLCTRVGVSKEEVAKAAEENRKAARAVWDDAWKRAGRLSAPLLEALDRAGIEARMNHRSERARWEKQASDHYWVEYRGGSAEKWISLDPSFPGAEAGRTFGVRGRPVAKVSPKQHGRLTVQIALKRKINGRQKDRLLLSIPTLLSDALYEPLSLQIAPAQRLPGIRETFRMKEEALYALASRFEKFQAILSRGKRDHASHPFDLRGQVYRVTKDGMLGGVDRDLAHRIERFIEETKEQRVEFQGIELRLKIDLPGRASKLQTRMIYEPRKGNAAYLSPVLEADLFVQPHWISAEYAAYMPARFALEGRGAFLAAYAERPRMKGRPPRYPAFLLNFALHRQSAAARLQAESAASIGMMWETPFIALKWSRLRIDPKGRRLARRKVLDIVENDGPFFARAAEGAGAAWKGNLTLGLFDSSLEGPILSQDADYAARRFEEAFASGKTLATIRPEARKKGTADLLSAADRAWIDACTPKTHALIHTGDKPILFWWSVDARTGSCVGRVSGGGGQGIIEEVIRLGLVVVGFFLCQWSASIDLAQGFVKDDLAQYVQGAAKSLACMFGFYGGIIALAAGSTWAAVAFFTLIMFLFQFIEDAIKTMRMFQDK